MNQKNSLRFLISGFCIIVSSSLLAIAEPALPPPDFHLDRMAVDINSERVLIESGKTIDIVRGDLVTIIDAWPTDPKRKIDSVDFVGFAPAHSKINRDDRGFIINTFSDLKTQFAKNTDKSIYEIQARIGEATIGSAFIHIIEPRLERVEVSVNGKIRKLHDGDLLTLKSTDKIAVKHVITNVHGNENVHHELRTQQPQKGGSATRELIFARGDQVFGRIPLQWQE